MKELLIYGGIAFVIYKVWQNSTVSGSLQTSTGFYKPAQGAQVISQYGNQSDPMNFPMPGGGTSIAEDLKDIFSGLGALGSGVADIVKASKAS